MMYIAHDSARYGYLQQNGKPIPPDSIARRCGCTLDEYLVLLRELDDAAVPSRTPKGIIFSRRMVRDEKERQQSAERVRKFRKTKDNCNDGETPRNEVEDEEERAFEVDVGTKTPKTKQSRIPEDFIPKDEHYALAASLGIICDMEFQKFRDYFLGLSGPKAVKRDWDATLRNWLRNSVNYGGHKTNARQPSKTIERANYNANSILAGLGVKQNAAPVGPDSGERDSAGRGQAVVRDVQGYEARDARTGVSQLPKNGEVLPKAR